MTWSATRAQTAPQAWATYSNPQLGVAFKHPAGMKVPTYQAGQKRVAEFLAMEPYAQVNFEVSLNATDRNWRTTSRPPEFDTKSRFPRFLTPRP